MSGGVRDSANGQFVSPVPTAKVKAPGTKGRFPAEYKARAIELANELGLAEAWKQLPEPRPDKSVLWRWAKAAGIQTTSVTAERARERMATASEAAKANLEERRVTMAQQAEETARWILDEMRKPTRVTRRVDGVDVEVGLEHPPARDLDAYASAVSRLVATSRLMNEQSTQNTALHGTVVTMTAEQALVRARELRDQLTGTAPDPGRDSARIVTVVPRSA